MKAILITLTLLLSTVAYGYRIMDVEVIGSDDFIAKVSGALVVISITPDSGSLNWMDFVRDNGLVYIIEFNNNNMYELFQNCEPYPDEYTIGYFDTTRTDRIYIRNTCRDFSATIVHEATHLYCYRTKSPKNYTGEYYPVLMEKFFRGCRRAISSSRSSSY